MKNTIREIKVSYTSGEEDKVSVKNSEDSYKLFFSNWDKNTLELQEEFKVMLLNKHNKVLGIYPMSKGGVSVTIVDAKLLFSVALKCNASNIIIAHNHPSGNLKPSEVDKKVTQKLKEGATLLDISLLDHLIITNNGYYSFSGNGLM